MGEAVSVVAVVPKDQRLSYRITPGPGGIMSAQSIGGQLEAIGDLVKSQMEKDDPRKWSVGVLRINTNAEGQVEFDLVIAPQSKGRWKSK